MGYKQQDKTSRHNILFKFWTNNFKVGLSDKLGLLYLLWVIKLHKNFQVNFQDFSWRPAINIEEFWSVRDLDVLEMPFKEL